MITFLLAMLMIAGCFGGCAQGQPDPTTTGEQLQATTAAPTTEAATTPAATTEAVTTPAETTEPPATTPKATEPPKTEPPKTEPPATTPKPTDPPKTEPPATTPKPTEAPKPTNPPATTPKPTDPPKTEPPHEHNYKATYTKDPTCEENGYIKYECSCGKSYKDSEVAALGHKPVETERKDATSTEEGYIKYTCERCGAVSTETIEKVKEEINIAELEAYARAYAESLGYEIVIGVRDGYYPAVEYYVANMEHGKKIAKEVVDRTTDWLIASGCEIAKEMEDGTIGRARYDFVITYQGDGRYLFADYYG